MYNTLTSRNNLLVITKYGFEHNRGGFPVRSGTNIENFIGNTSDNKQKQNKKFLKNVNKALSSKKVIVSF